MYNTYDQCNSHTIMFLQLLVGTLHDTCFKIHNTGNINQLSLIISIYIVVEENLEICVCR